jgi:hypothetical protein
MNQTQNWPNIGAHVEKRIADLETSARGLEVRWKDTDRYVSEATWAALRQGRPVTRPWIRSRAMRALGWTPASFDAMLAGGEPTALDELDEPMSDVMARFDDFDRRLIALERVMQRLLASMPPPAPPGTKGNLMDDLLAAQDRKKLEDEFRDRFGEV